MDQHTWDNFVATAPGSSFLQSWAWGELQKALSVPYWRLTVRQQGKLTGVALVLRRDLPNRRSWLYVPRGPVGVDDSTQQQLLAQIVQKAVAEQSVFVRAEPASVPAGQWQKAERDVQPRHTLALDVLQPLENVLAAMHQKTRYNIRLAQRRGVTVRFSDAPEDIEHFLRLSAEVNNRSGFSYHPDAYYRTMRDVLRQYHTRTPGRQSVPMFDIAVAEYEGQVLAVHLLIGFGPTLTYVHGASSSQARGVMAPHLLQWASIERAKAQGYHWYDFFGIASSAALAEAQALGGRPHPWQGITRFKEGFGGQRREYPGAYDYVTDPLWYWVYNTGRKMKGLLR